MVKAAWIWIGREALLPEASGLTVRVLIEDVREVFGRRDYLVRPVAGVGSAWVAASRVMHTEGGFE